MKPGDWVRLRRTLAFEEGFYKVVAITEAQVKVRGEDGRFHVLNTGQFEHLVVSHEHAKRRLGTPADFFSQDEGVLAAMGYHVGERGLTREQRRSVLARVFQTPLERLPQVGDDSYMAQWGAGNSHPRFNKMFSCLHTFYQNALSRRNPPREAIDDWKEDFDWFVETFGG
jgi:hypothetical protein